MGLLQGERIDLVKTLVHVPVPPEIFKETEERIRMEMAILKAHGEVPGTVTCIVADEILREAVGTPDMPQDGKRGIRELKNCLGAAIIAPVKACEAYGHTEKVG